MSNVIMLYLQYSSDETQNNACNMDFFDKTTIIYEPQIHSLIFVKYSYISL